jgi:hypothetical protein
VTTGGRFAKSQRAIAVTLVSSCCYPINCAPRTIPFAAEGGIEVAASSGSSAKLVQPQTQRYGRRSTLNSWRGGP